MNHTATLLPDGRVFVAGGNNADGALGDTLLYDVATNTWTPATSLHVARTQHSAALLPDGRVLLAGAHQTTPAERPQRQWKSSTPPPV